MFPASHLRHVELELDQHDDGEVRNERWQVGHGPEMFPESREMFPESHEMFPESREMFPESREMFPESGWEHLRGAR